MPSWSTPPRIKSTGYEDSAPLAHAARLRGMRDAYNKAGTRGAKAKANSAEWRQKAMMDERKSNGFRKSVK